MNQSLFWHDYETSGINPSFDQPLQFAGIRTNENLDIIGDPIVLFCKPHLDIIPSPQACPCDGNIASASILRRTQRTRFYIDYSCGND